MSKAEICHVTHSVDRYKSATPKVDRYRTYLTSQQECPKLCCVLTIQNGSAHELTADNFEKKILMEDFINKMKP